MQTHIPRRVDHLSANAQRLRKGHIGKNEIVAGKKKLGSVLLIGNRLGLPRAAEQRKHIQFHAPQSLLSATFAQYCIILKNARFVKGKLALFQKLSFPRAPRGQKTQKFIKKSFLSRIFMLY